MITLSLVRRVMAGATIAVVVAGCAASRRPPPADLPGRVRVEISHTPQAPIPPLVGARPLTIFQFADERPERDRGRYRVGGVYAAVFGLPMGAVVTDVPFQWTLVRILAAAFRARGVEVTAIEDREVAPEVSPDGLALAGAWRRFETRGGTLLQADVEAVITLYDRGGVVVMVKRLSTRHRAAMDLRWMFGNPQPFLERALNEAVAQFVDTLVVDPDIVARLLEGRGAGR